MRVSKIAAVVLAGAIMLPPLVTEATARTRITVRKPARIYIEPNLLAWHRRCTDWYALERRPSGTVLTPHMRCWWTRH